MANFSAAFCVPRFLAGRCSVSSQACFLSVIVSMCVNVVDAPARSFPVPDYVTGAVVDEDAVKVTIYVDQSHPKADDTNAGTEALPLKSLQTLAKRIKDSVAEGNGIRVVIKSGVYRNMLHLESIGNREKPEVPVVIEAEKPGSVFISGSEVWTKWTKAGSGLYTHHWPHKWSKIKIGHYESWKKWIQVAPILHRKEMVLVNGKLLRQVLAKELLKEGCFFAAEEEEKLYIFPASNTDIKNSKVEVAKRGEGAMFILSNCHNFVIRGLTIEHSIDNGLSIGSCSNIMVEENVCRWNNRTGGPTANTCQNMTFLRNRSLHNGYSGMPAGNIRNFLVEENETSYNNWRGDWAKFYGWDVNGMKQLEIRGAIYRNNRSIGNKTGGFWFDYDNRDILVEGGVYAFNKSYGIHLEINAGPIVFRNNIFAFNGNSGIYADHSEQIQLYNNIFYKNRPAQISVAGGESRVMFTEEKARLEIKLRNWKMYGNVFVADGDNTLFDSTYAKLDLFLRTLEADKNLWYHPSNQKAIRLSDTPLTLEQWRNVSMQGNHSAFGRPGFKDPENLDFSYSKDSLAHQFHYCQNRDAEFAVNFAKFGAARLQSIIDASAKPYEYLTTIENKTWHLFDISKVANRGLVGKRGWMGGTYTLDYFETGKQHFHGIPFNIIDQESNNDSSIIVLKSTKLKRLYDVDTPEEVTLPVNDKFKVLYILHGCGWAIKHEEVAKYILAYKDGTSVEKSIRPFGSDQQLDIPDADILRSMRLKSDLQDWWPTLPHFENTNAKKVGIVNPENPLGYTRFVYSMQWKNPHPDKEIKDLRLVSAKGTEATLFIIAISGLR